MGIGYEEVFPQPGEARGELRYYKIGGQLMQQAQGLDVVHDRLEGAGVGVYDGLIGRSPDDGDSIDGPQLHGEIAVLRPLGQDETNLIRGLGGTVVELMPGAGDLYGHHMRHLQQNGEQEPKEAA